MDTVATDSTTRRIAGIVGPTLEGMGYLLVRVTLGGGQRARLQIMAEPLDGREMAVEDCEQISRVVSALLDVDDPIEGAYVLEVSSPGIERPLTRLTDYQRFAGREARLETRGAVEGRKRFRGQLAGIEDEKVLIDTEEGQVAVPYAEIGKARLVLTDAMFAAAAKAR